MLLPAEEVSTLSAILTGNAPTNATPALSGSHGWGRCFLPFCTGQRVTEPWFHYQRSSRQLDLCPEREQPASPLASPRLGCKQANLSPSCFICAWCWLPLTWILTLGVGGISRKTFVVCHWFPVSPPLSLSFSRLQELLNGTSWTPNTLG